MRARQVSHVTEDPNKGVLQLDAKEQAIPASLSHECNLCHTARVICMKACVDIDEESKEP